jgi:precorrin-3B C17-methyltransferase
MANKLYILSSGAGGTKYMTTEALEALDESEVVVGYRNYIKELKELIGDKPIFMSGMKREIARCQEAINYAKEGKTTAIISNGDVNVFGMATLIIELVDKQNLWEEIEVISIAGVTAFLATASRIGAPISQDFAVISLSDKLTDINIIDKRVRNCLDADMILGIYNPKSKKRILPYQNFLRALSEGEERIAIIASHVGRDREKVVVTTTSDLIAQDITHPEITMSTLIIIGNSQTRVTTNGLILTPRGYLNKYEMSGELKDGNEK